ncbi:hypothetical protein [Thermoleptolyngbya sp. C42_A2020_037]|uniref:hypothetical protein n=1 Tax=Thermoleptolyngbya sp. C42_A2020_037 TaxID=2747799 RepID=UPI0019FCEEBE|nr:hypothetical protein [Thermoleptolyngbya sp. C42_A2020_037]MBF2085677.1 hypothetical protein [Thermoleptolyngbya sp. C42_A2020_037]
MTSTIARFESKEAYYASFPSPPEILIFEWDTETGKPIRLEWQHGGAVWFLYHAPGQITRETPDFNYYDVNLRMTTTGYEHAAYGLKGKLTVDAHRPSGATFAGIYEGTGTAWFVADGFLTYTDAS